LDFFIFFQSNYFIYNLQVGPINLANKKLLIKVSFQVVSDAVIQNFASTIMRTNYQLIPNSYIDYDTVCNIANNLYNNDIMLSNIYDTSNILTALNTSLWSINNNSTNGITVYYEKIDTPTEDNDYYTVRVATDSTSDLYYGNLNISIIEIN